MGLDLEFSITAASEAGDERQEDRAIVHGTSDGVLLAVVNGYGGTGPVSVCADYLSELWEQSYRLYEPQTALREIVRDLANITEDFQTQAATISIAYIDDAGKTAHVAILGDCPVIAEDRNTKAIRISPGHNLHINELERADAARRGGCDMGDGYIRIEPQGPGLPTGRALGMGMLGPIISKEPEVFDVDIGNYLLLATTGVFGSRNCEFAASFAWIVRRIENGADAWDLVHGTEENATAILVRRHR